MITEFRILENYDLSQLSQTKRRRLQMTERRANKRLKWINKTYPHYSYKQSESRDLWFDGFAYVLIMYVKAEAEKVRPILRPFYAAQNSILNQLIEFGVVNHPRL